MSPFLTLRTKDTINNVENFLCKFYKIPNTTLHTKRKSQQSSLIRFIAWYMIKKETELSYSTLAEIYGMDHSTIMYGIRRAGNLPLSDETARCYKAFITSRG